MIILVSSKSSSSVPYAFLLTESYELAFEDVLDMLLAKNYANYPHWIGNQEKIEDGIRYATLKDIEVNGNTYLYLTNVEDPEDFCFRKNVIS